MFESITKMGVGLVAAAVMAGTLPASAAVVGLWHFDGNMDDATGNSTATLNSKSKYDNEQYQVGTDSLQVNPVQVSTNTYAGVQTFALGSAAQLNGESAFGLAFWVRMSADTAAYKGILSFGSGLFQIERGVPEHENLYVIANSGLGSWGHLYDRYITIEPETWTHIAVTADGDSATVYVDGVAKRTITQTGALNMSGTLYLGGVNTYTQLNYNSTNYDELILYKGDPGATWAADLYQQGLAGHNTQVPEPASMSLLILGGVVLLGRRRG